MKKCCRCGRNQQLSAFNHYHGSKDGFEARCRYCQKAKKHQERLDAIDFQNHPKQTKTWIRNVLRTWDDEPPLEVRIRLAENLYKLLCKQPTCPYLGTKLIPTIDCNLDHKLPLSRDGKKWDIKNLQFVSRRYNLAKNDLTDQEFLNLAKLIVKNSKL